MRCFLLFAFLIFSVVAIAADSISVRAQAAPDSDQSCGTTVDSALNQARSAIGDLKPDAYRKALVCIIDALAKLEATTAHTSERQEGTKVLVAPRTDQSLPTHAH
ncbi:MAG TPA: hypothetical protein VE986_10055 [Hyphomicrobiales bacterium]|nr:hypothetical protein [Hyphomicrobiales bacterium]